MAHGLETSGTLLCLQETQANTAYAHPTAKVASRELWVRIQRARQAKEQLNSFVNLFLGVCTCGFKSWITNGRPDAEPPELGRQKEKCCLCLRVWQRHPGPSFFQPAPSPTPPRGVMLWQQAEVCRADLPGAKGCLVRSESWSDLRNHSHDCSSISGHHYPFMEKVIYLFSLLILCFFVSSHSHSALSPFLTWYIANALKKIWLLFTSPVFNFKGSPKWKSLKFYHIWALLTFEEHHSWLLLRTWEFYINSVLYVLHLILQWWTQVNIIFSKGWKYSIAFILCDPFACCLGTFWWFAIYHHSKPGLVQTTLYNSAFHIWETVSLRSISKGGISVAESTHILYLVPCCQIALRKGYTKWSSH